LRTTPGVAKAEALNRDSLAGLLEPWLGRGNVSADLPLPQLIDVDIDPGVVDLAELARRIESIGSGVHFDDHAVWTKELLVAARSIQALALMAAGLIGVAAVAIVVFATRAGFATHIEIVELLHLMGAQDRYIARQFQRHFRRLSFKGGVWGLVFGGVTLFGLGQLASEMRGPLLPHFSLGWWGWGALLLLPPIASLVATATARLTVMRALRRLP
ncbi:MAG: FtsX-like permease family protein, partial [Alphaproteobacteria bacterium]|nr:FtsX-like permease family protein [Alphaproteobacteria bacterium]